MGSRLTKSGSRFRPLSTRRRRKQREPVQGKTVHTPSLYGKGGRQGKGWERGRQSGQTGVTGRYPLGCVWQRQDDIVIAPSFILRAWFPVPCRRGSGSQSSRLEGFVLTNLKTVSASLENRLSLTRVRGDDRLNPDKFIDAITLYACVL